MSQIPMDFGVQERVKAKRDRVLPLLREVMAVVGLKRFAIEAGVSESLIADAFAGRDRKHIRDEWVYLAQELAPDGLADRLSAEIAGPGYEVTRKRPLTAEEREEALRQALRKRLGPLADEIEREALGGGR